MRNSIIFILAVIISGSASAQVQKYVINGKTYYGTPPNEAYTEKDVTKERIKINNVYVDHEDAHRAETRLDADKQEWRDDVSRQEHRTTHEVGTEQYKRSRRSFDQKEAARELERRGDAQKAELRSEHIKNEREAKQRTTHK